MTHVYFSLIPRSTFWPVWSRLLLFDCSLSGGYFQAKTFIHTPLLFFIKCLWMLHAGPFAVTLAFSWNISFHSFLSIRVKLPRLQRPALRSPFKLRRRCSDSDFIWEISLMKRSEADRPCRWPCVTHFRPRWLFHSPVFAPATPPRRHLLLLHFDF